MNNSNNSTYKFKQTFFNEYRSLIVRFIYSDLLTRQNCLAVKHINHMNSGLKGTDP